MVSPEKFLLPEEDGLKNRPSQEYARDKLKIVSVFLEMFCTSMKDKPWRAKYYLDLEAGPGKDEIGKEILLGSPLIALQTPYGFTNYHFNEIDKVSFEALEQRVKASPRAVLAKLTQEDINKIVYSVCDEIDATDSSKNYGNQWSTLNLAFLDPEGLELEWTTVERLAQVRRMDLIINFPTGGIRRVGGTENVEKINRLFGTTEWQQIHDSTTNPTARRRGLIDLYLGRLKKYGYIDIHEIDAPFRNSRGAQVYSLIFASKHELGEKFWRETTRRRQQPPLF